MGLWSDAELGMFLLGMWSVRVESGRDQVQCCPDRLQGSGGCRNEELESLQGREFAGVAGTQGSHQQAQIA
jgi:hypothetical protein